MSRFFFNINKSKPLNILSESVYKLTYSKGQKRDLFKILKEYRMYRNLCIAKEILNWK